MPDREDWEPYDLCSVCGGRDHTEDWAPDMACTSCRHIITEDPSGLCEDCQTDVASERPGSVTEAQRWTLAGLMMDLCVLLARELRAETMAAGVDDWPAGEPWSADLGRLSQRQAGDLLTYLGERRRS